MQHMDKANEKHFKLSEIKMTWWLTPLPSPKEMKVFFFEMGIGLRISCKSKSISTCEN